MTKKNGEDVKEKRSKAAKDAAEESAEGRAKHDEARQARHDALRADADAQREKAIDLSDDEDEDEDKDPVLHDGKPGSGAGLKPGDWHAPASNPGAAARVPAQPLQPESMQSHGLGILHDKDLDNGPFDGDVDPEEVDRGPFGSPKAMDKDAEAEKAESMSARKKQRDPDNPTVGAGGKKDATASPNPIGSRSASKTNVSGGSNSGSQA